jgi:DNA-binding NarL/FixJ family response regulator
MERAARVDKGSPPLAGRLVAVVTARDDQVTMQRMAAAVAAGGLLCPLRAGGLEEASLAVASNSPVMVFACDVSDPTGIASLRRLRERFPKADIVAVSPATHARGVRRALDAGADGLVFESDLEDALVPSVAAVAAGQTAVPRGLRAVLHRPAFSHRERQVIGHVAAGLTNSEIAAALFLCESTVKSHLASAFAKLGVSSRKDAAALVLDPDQGLRAELLAAGVRVPVGVTTNGDAP